MSFITTSSNYVDYVTLLFLCFQPKSLHMAHLSSLVFEVVEYKHPVTVSKLVSRVGFCFQLT